MATFIGILLIFTIYLPLTLSLGSDFYLVNGPGVIFAIVHLFRRTNLGLLSKVCGGSFLFVFSVCLLSDDTASFVRRILSGGQFPYTLLCSMMAAFSRPYSETEKRIIVRVLQIAMAVLTALATFEPYVPFLSTISDSVRVQVYPDQILYMSVERDLLFSGRIRPNVFCSEPSQASWGIVLLAILVFALSAERRPRVTSMVVLLISAVAFSSPAALVATAILVVIYLLEMGSISFSAVVTGLLVTGFVGVPLAIVSSEILSNRYAMQVSILDEGSTYVRLAQPFMLAYEALLYNPLLGVGFAGLESIWTKIEVIEGGRDVESLRMSAGAALLTIPLFTGLLGCALFFIFFKFLVARVSPHRRLGFTVLLLFLLSQKSHFSNTTAWFVVGVYLAANAVQSTRPRGRTAATDGNGGIRPIDGTGLGHRADASGFEEMG